MTSAEVMSGRSGADLGPSEAKSVAWFDVTDLVVFMSNNQSVTGIERVVMMLLLALDGEAFGRESAAAGGRLGEVRVCYFDFDDNVYVEDTLVRFKDRLIRFLAGEKIPREFSAPIPVDPQPRPSLIARLFGRKKPSAKAAARIPPDRVCAFRPGDVFVMLGAIWFRTPYVQVAVDACVNYGLRLCVLIHDLIPVRFPNWFPPGYADELVAVWAAVLSKAEVVLANSRYSAHEIERFCQERGIQRRPAAVLRFGDEISANRADVPTDDGGRVTQYRRHGFVLMVGSIGIRKNQELLIRVWRRLYAAHGERTPYLILIGKPVGESGVAQALAECRFVEGRIVCLEDVIDAELAEFYRGSTFTVFPSLVEGWGLPVAESLVHGKLCIASSSSAIPEIAGDLLAYFDPNDEDECHRLVEGYYFTPGLREAAEQRIRENYRPTTWMDSARGMVKAISDGLVEFPRSSRSDG